MENEFDIFGEYEYKEGEFSDITHMLWLIYEDYYALQKDDLYTKADNYDRLGTYLINIHSLLYSKTEEMRKNINKIYESRRNINTAPIQE